MNVGWSINIRDTHVQRMRRFWADLRRLVSILQYSTDDCFVGCPPNGTHRKQGKAGSICPLGMLAHSAPGDAISLEAEHRCVARLIAKLLTSRRLKLQNTKDLPAFLARGRLFEVFFGFISKHSIT